MDSTGLIIIFVFFGIVIYFLINSSHKGWGGGTGSGCSGGGCSGGSSSSGCSGGSSCSGGGCGGGCGG